MGKARGERELNNDESTAPRSAFISLRSCSSRHFLLSSSDLSIVLFLSAFLQPEFLSHRPQKYQALLLKNKQHLPVLVFVFLRDGSTNPSPRRRSIIPPSSSHLMPTHPATVLPLLRLRLSGLLAAVPNPRRWLGLAGANSGCCTTCALRWSKTYVTFTKLDPQTLPDKRMLHSKSESLLEQMTPAQRDLRPDLGQPGAKASLRARRLSDYLFDYRS